LPGRCVVALIFVCHALNHSRCGIGFSEAGRNGEDANPSGADFIRQGLAVISERGFRCRISKGRIMRNSFGTRRRLPVALTFRLLFFPRLRFTIHLARF
jgi:hypothetical protein